VLANLEVKWLYDVIALEESRSFTLAAKARNISQSSFSRRIQSLEAPSDSASSIVAPTPAVDQPRENFCRLCAKYAR
jgi:hypothetical protein